MERKDRIPIEIRQLTAPKAVTEVPKAVEMDCIDACAMGEARALYEVCMDVICGCPQCQQEAKRSLAWGEFPTLPDEKFARSFIKVFEGYERK